MMQENDPRIKELQNSAWGLQTMTNKPGNKIPEQVKRDAYKVTSKGIELCNDAVYIEEEDWVRRAAVLKKQIEAKRLEVEAAEKEQTEKNTGKCYRSLGNGQYAIGSKTSPAPVATPQASSKPATSRGFDQELAVQSALNLHSDPSPPRSVKALETKKKEDEKGEKDGEEGPKEKKEEKEEGSKKEEQSQQERSKEREAATKVEPKVESKAETAAGTETGGAEAKGHGDAPSPAADPPASSEKAATCKLHDEGGVDGNRLFRVEVQLPPEIASVRDLEVDISDTRLLVQDADRTVEFANVSFPSAGDPEGAKAAFSKKKHLLTVTLPPR